VSESFSGTLDWVLVVVCDFAILCASVWGIRASQGFGIGYSCRTIMLLFFQLYVPLRTWAKWGWGVREISDQYCQ
jgi:hypothetical protein